MTTPGATGQVAYIFPGPSSFPRVPNPADENTIQSRVCEQVYLEPALFGGTGDTEIVALFEEFYPVLTALFRRPISPGSLGEQIVIRGIDPSLLTAGSRVTIGDAIFRVVSAPDLQIGEDLLNMNAEQILADLPACRLVQTEEGLAEPGAPVMVEPR